MKISPDKSPKGTPHKIDNWEAEDMARTVQRAEEIKNDPHKAKAVHLHLKKTLKANKSAIESIADLRKLAEERSEKEIPGNEDSETDERD